MVAVVPTQHSVVGASGYERWSECQGAPTLLRALALEIGAHEGDAGGSSEFAREGTAAHELAGWCLNEDREPWELTGEVINVEGHDVLVDDEMVDGVTAYVDYCNDLRARTAAGEWWVEKGFHRPEWHPEFFGTSDYGLVARSTGDVHIVDFKYGKGIYVEPEWNGQLLYYAAGALKTLDLFDMVAWRIHLHIVQPRADRGEGITRSWTISSNRLREWTHNTLLPAMRATDDPEAPLTSGDHCRWCPAKTRCPALTRAYEEAGAGARDISTSKKLLARLSPETLVERYEKAAAVRAYLKAVGEEVYGRLAAGKEAPGYKLVRKSAARQWKPNTLAERERLFGKRTVYEVRERSPAQTEALLTKEQKEELKRLSAAPDTGLTVAPASDKKAAVQPRTAEDVFSGVHIGKD